MMFCEKMRTPSQELEGKAMVSVHETTKAHLESSSLFTNLCNMQVLREHSRRLRGLASLRLRCLRVSS
jgi:hypothetical protein